MPGRNINRFRMLLAQRATRRQQNIALMDVQRETGIAWANNQVTRCDAPVIKALCEYFDCQVGIRWFLRGKARSLHSRKNRRQN